MAETPKPLPGYEDWKARQQKRTDNPYGLSDTSQGAYLEHMQREGAMMSDESEDTTSEQYGEIYATPNREQQAALRAHRTGLGAPQLGAIEAATGKQITADPIATVAQEAIFGPVFKGAGAAWGTGKRLLGFGDEAAEAAAKVAARSPSEEAAHLATRTFRETPDAVAPAGIAGATTAREAEEAARLWNVPGLDRFLSKYFGRWFKESDAIGREGVTGTPGVPLTAWHATPRLVTAFDDNIRRRLGAGTENFFGDANYLTTSILDASENYARVTGGDVATSMYGAFKQLVARGVPEGEASRLAAQQVVDQGHYRLMPLHISMQNPLVLDPTGRRASTVLQPDQIVRGYLDYFKRNPELWSDASANAFIDDVVATGAQRATDVFEQLRALHPERFGSIINRIARENGFDGMVASAKGYFPNMPGVADDTYHYMTFAGNQIKSAYHKGKKQTGLFSPDPNIYRAAPIVGAGAAGAAATMEEDEEL
tara:strand:+ start:5798 stop:7246 length:1449 start_codon:yes stop_codon:yes gene_type:complete